MEDSVTDRPKILVVDDDPGWLEELDSLLGEAGYVVETAPSFEVAGAKLLTATYAAIIVDLALSKDGVSQEFEGLGLLSGLQFLERVPRRQGKAIVLSAYGSIEHIRQAFKRGAHDFMEKQHFDESRFLDTVREAVDWWKSSRILAPQRELTPAEMKEYKRITRQFLRGQSIHLDVPDDAVNPWAKQS